LCEKQHELSDLNIAEIWRQHNRQKCQSQVNIDQWVKSFVGANKFTQLELAPFKNEMRHNSARVAILLNIT